MVTENWDTQIARVILKPTATPVDSGLSNFYLGTLSRARVFTTGIGTRPAEPCSISLAAMHQLLTQLLLHLMFAVPDASDTTYDKREVLELSRLNDNSIATLDEMVNPSSAVHAALVAQGRRWGHHILESPICWLISAMYIATTVILGTTPLATLASHIDGLISSTDHLSAALTASAADMNLTLATAPAVEALVADCVGAHASAAATAVGACVALALREEPSILSAPRATYSYALGGLDAAIYIFLPIWTTWLLRLVQRRPLLHRVAGRTLVIGDVPWVAQSLEAFVSKIFSLSYSIASLNVHSANPVDHFVHRHTHRVVRGALVAVGRPDGRLSALTSAEESVKLSVKQASSIQNWGVTCESITLGHNPTKDLKLTQKDIVLPTQRPLFLTEAMLMLKLGTDAITGKAGSLIGAMSDARTKLVKTRRSHFDRALEQQLAKIEAELSAKEVSSRSNIRSDTARSGGSFLSYRGSFSSRGTRRAVKPRDRFLVTLIDSPEHAGEATLITVEGPDVPGLLNAITTALGVEDCVIVNFKGETAESGQVLDTFIVTRHGHPIDPGEAAVLRARLKDACGALISNKRSFKQPPARPSTSQTIDCAANVLSRAGALDAPADSQNGDGGGKESFGEMAAGLANGARDKRRRSSTPGLIETVPFLPMFATTAPATATVSPIADAPADASASALTMAPANAPATVAAAEAPAPAPAPALAPAATSWFAAPATVPVEESRSPHRRSSSPLVEVPKLNLPEAEAGKSLNAIFEAAGEMMNGLSNRFLSGRQAPTQERDEKEEDDDVESAVGSAQLDQTAHELEQLTASITEGNQRISRSPTPSQTSDPGSPAALFTDGPMRLAALKSPSSDDHSDGNSSDADSRENTFKRSKKRASPELQEDNLLQQVRTLVADQVVGAWMLKEDETLEGLTDAEMMTRQELMQTLYESRLASLQRLVGFMILFHAMGKLVQDFWPRISFGFLGYDMSRTQSIMRVASTAAPVSGSEVRHRMVTLGNDEIRHWAARQIQSALRLYLKLTRWDRSKLRGIFRAGRATELCEAASKADVKRLCWLVRERGYDVNSGDYDKRTAIHL